MRKTWAEITATPEFKARAKVNGSRWALEVRQQYVKDLAELPEYQQAKGPTAKQAVIGRYLGVTPGKVDTGEDVRASVVSGVTKSLPVQAGFAVTNPIRKLLGQDPVNPEDLTYEPQTTAGKIAGPVAEGLAEAALPGGAAIKGAKGGIRVARTALGAAGVGAAQGGSRSALSDVNAGRGIDVSRALKTAAIEGGVSAVGGTGLAVGVDALGKAIAKRRMPASVRRVSERISVGGKKGLAEKVGEQVSMARHDYLDDLAGVQRAEKQMGGTGEIYEAARLTRGTGGKVQQMIETGPVEFSTLQPTGARGLQQILDDVQKHGPGAIDEFRSYATAKRALELESQGRKSGVPIIDALDSVLTLGPKYRERFQEIQDYQNAVLKYARDAGTISDDAYNAIKGENLAYVPFKRVQDLDAQFAGSGGGKRFVNLQSGIKALVGSEKEIVDPFESMVKNTHDIVAAADKNAVSRALVDLARANPGTELLKPAKRRIETRTDTQGNQVEVIGDPEDPGAVSVIIDGQRKYFEVDPELKRSLEALDRPILPKAIKILQVPASTLRAGAVLSPEFMGTNPVRDTFSAWINTKYGFVPVWDTVRGAFHVMGKSDLYKKWRLAGGDNSLMTTMDRESVQKQMDNALKTPGKEALNVLNPIAALRALSDLSEKSTRVGEFTRGVAKEGTSKEGLQKAAFSSRDLIDFQRMGSQMQSLNAINAFLNARVQGWEKLGRQLSDPKTASQAWAKGAFGLTIPSMALTAVNMQDERWDGILDWEKVVFWHILVPNGPTLRIPKPPGYGSIFATPFERITEYVGKKDPKALEKLASIATQEAPQLIPTAMAPPLEHFANKSFFRNAPLVSADREGLDPAYQTAKGTTETAKALGEQANFSPAILENYVRGYGGGLGMRALEGADLVTPRGQEAAKKKLPAGIEKAPGLRAFVSSAERGSDQVVDNFYKALKESETKEKTFRMLLKEQPDEADTYFVKNQAQIERYQGLQKLADHLANFRKEEQDILSNKDLPGAVKLKQIKSLRRERHALVKEIEPLFAGATGAAQ